MTSIPPSTRRHHQFNNFNVFYVGISNFRARRVHWHVSVRTDSFRTSSRQTHGASEQGSLVRYLLFITDHAYMSLTQNGIYRIGK